MRRLITRARQQPTRHQTYIELRSAVVVVVQAAEDWCGDDLAMFGWVSQVGRATWLHAE
jgi:hypothetical protein